MSLPRICPACGKSWPDAARCPDDGTALVALKPVEDPLIGVELDGRFTVRARVGRGGMGTVYRAWQHSVGREVAVKVLTAPDDEVASKRFMREANLLGQVNHPGIVSVLDFGQLPDGRLYLTMELIDGRTLAELLEAEGRLPLARIIAIATQLCDVLEAAHHRGIVHRDLKPSNVMVMRSPSGRDHVKVLDFGLARALADSARYTASGTIVGSAHFMAPEVMSGDDATVAADLYALGGVLYWMVAGRLPFGSGGMTEVFRLQAEGKMDALQADVPPALGQLITRLMDVTPARRPRSAAVVREMLLSLDDAAASTSRDSQRVVAPARGWLGPVVTAVLLAAAGTGWGLWARRVELPGPSALDAGALPMPVASFDAGPLVARVEAPRSDDGGSDAGQPVRTAVTAAEVLAVVERNRAALSGCAATWRKQHPGQGGSATLEFLVTTLSGGAEASVAQVTVRDGVRSASLERCVHSVMGDARFGPADGELRVGWSLSLGQPSASPRPPSDVMPGEWMP